MKVNLGDHVSEKDVLKHGNELLKKELGKQVSGVTRSIQLTVSSNVHVADEFVVTIVADTARKVSLRCQPAAMEIRVTFSAKTCLGRTSGRFIRNFTSSRIINGRIISLFSMYLL